MLIAHGTSLSPKAQVDRGTSIGKHCLILESKIAGCSRIGDRVRISTGASLYNCELAQDCHIESNAQLAGSRLEMGVCVHREAELCDVNVGRFSYVARETLVNDVDIGGFCSIGPRCVIGSGDHPVDWLATSPAFYSERFETFRLRPENQTESNAFRERSRITIGHDVWIGAHAFLRDGVCIGNGAIIGAGAVVIRDVPSYAIVGGVPAKMIRSRFAPAAIEQMEAIAWWDWLDDELRDVRSTMAGNNVAELYEFAKERNLTP